MTFRVGQKVVCVDASNAPSLHQGSIYTVTKVAMRDFWDTPGIQLFETKPTRNFEFFESLRFRPVVERKTDISVFTEILRTTKAPVNADARCFVGSHQDGGVS